MQGARTHGELNIREEEHAGNIISFKMTFLRIIWKIDT